MTARPLALDRVVAARPRWSLTLGGVVRVAAPLSSADLVAYFDATGRPITGGLSLAAMVRLWRRAFPWRWRYLRDGDPVRLALSLPDEYRDGLTLSLVHHEIAAHRAGWP